jgi:plasmid rolling circle replication initiator protein Rep
LLVVKGSYFSKNYIIITEWWEMWQQSLGLNYKPNIDIKVVTDKQNKKIDATDDIKKIIF